MSEPDLSHPPQNTTDDGDEAERFPDHSSRYSEMSDEAEAKNLAEQTLRFRRQVLVRDLHEDLRRETGNRRGRSRIQSPTRRARFLERSIEAIDLRTGYDARILPGISEAGSGFPVETQDLMEDDPGRFAAYSQDPNARDLQREAVGARNITGWNAESRQIGDAASRLRWNMRFNVERRRQDPDILQSSIDEVDEDQRERWISRAKPVMDSNKVRARSVDDAWRSLNRRRST